MRAYEKFFFSVVCLFLAGCNSDSTSSTPSPVDPTSGTTNPLSTGGNTSTGNLKLQNLMLSYDAALKLVDNTKYSALQAMLGSNLFVAPPLVGDVLISAAFDDSSRATTTSAIFYLQFEDQEGIWATQLNSYPMLAVRDSQNFDFTFGDDNLSFRVLANLPTGSSTLSGAVFMRPRQSGETGCDQVVSSCTDTAANCQAYQYQLSLQCRSYMDVTQTSVVQQVGTFTVPYSTWALSSGFATLQSEIKAAE